jgi:hypothetical protein
LVKFYEGLYDSLSLYVRHSAWLNAVPSKAKITRLEDQQKQGIVVFMPDMAVPHLVRYLYEIGPTLPGGMGAVPLTHSEIMAWQSNTGVELQPWEARFLYRLSREFLSQSHKSEAPECPPPWVDAPPEVNREQVGKSLFNVLEKMRKSK